MPFTKQFFHIRELQRSGKTPQFGSYIYSAQELYDKGILLSIDQFSPRQFDRIDMVLESNEIGIFIIKVTNTMNGITTEVATQELRMEDLLQANFEGRVSLSLFDGMAKVNLNLLLFQINKKFVIITRFHDRSYGVADFFCAGSTCDCVGLDDHSLILCFSSQKSLCFARIYQLHLRLRQCNDTIHRSWRMLACKFKPRLRTREISGKTHPSDQRFEMSAFPMILPCC